MRVLVLISCFCLGLQAQQPSSLHIELGYKDAAGDLEWVTQQDATRRSSAIRLVDDSPNADLDGAWCILMTRVHTDSEVPGTPSWLQSLGAEEPGFSAQSILTPEIAAMLDGPSLSQLPNRQLYTDQSMSQIYLHFAFLDTHAISGYGVCGTAADGNALNWRSMAPYWGGGLGFQLWAKTYQETTNGVDLFNHLRLAESAMETQAMSGATVRNYLQSPAYSTLLASDTLYLELQFCVIRCPNPYDPPMTLPWYAFLPQAPLLAAQEASLDYSIPLQLQLPLGIPDFNPSGNLIASQPGLKTTGNVEGSPVYFFVGNSVEVNTATFPLAAGGSLSKTLIPLDPNLPDLGIYATVLPVDSSLLDPLQSITLSMTGPVQSTIVVLKDMQIVSEIEW